MKYHVHVYRVDGLNEYDIEATSERRARVKALEQATLQGVWREPDCGLIALMPATSETDTDAPIDHE